MSKRILKTLAPLGLIASLAAGLVLASPADGQQTETITRELKATDSGAVPAGTVVPIATVDVPASLVGGTCTGSYTAVNNSSVWVGNDMVLSSATDSVTLAGVENSPGNVVAIAGTLTVPPTIQIDLIVGDNFPTPGAGQGKYSVEGVLTLECTPPPPAPTEPPATVAPTSVAVATTVPTQVAGAVEVAQAAQPVQVQPTFTG